ncbi:DMT family transporter [Escherichia coli]
MDSPKLVPSVVVVAGYGLAFYFLALKSIPVGIAYAVWAGLGIVLVELSLAFSMARN